MITINHKAIDTRQGLGFAEGHFGKLKWVASFFGKTWCVTIPNGCPNNDGIETMKLVRERLIELYPEA